MTIAELVAKLRIKPDQRSFDAADKLIGYLHKAVVGLAAIAGVNFMKGLVEDTVELGGHLNDLAQSAGVPIEPLQELGYAASLNSSSTEELAQALGILSKNMLAATNGGEEQQKMFDRMGVSIRNADGSLRSAQDVFEQLGDHFKSLPDGARKTAEAQEVLGKSGKNLIPTLNAGSAGLREMAQEARDLGGVISEDGVHALDEFGDAQDKVKFALKGLRNEAVVTLLPELQKLVDSLLGWIKQNRKLLIEKITKAVNLLIRGVKVLATVIGYAIDLFTFLGDHIELVEVAIISLGTALAIFKVASIQAAIASGAAWVVAQLPLILLAVLLAGLILLVEDFITGLEGGDSVLAEFFGQDRLMAFWETINLIAGGTYAAFKAVFDFLTGKFEYLMELGGKIGETLYDLTHANAQEQVDRQNAVKKFFPGADFSGADYGAIDAVRTAPAAPVTTATSGGSGSSVSAPVTINIEGLTGTPEQNGKAITDAFASFWNTEMRKASAGTGAGK